MLRHVYECEEDQMILPGITGLSVLEFHAPFYTIPLYQYTDYAIDLVTTTSLKVGSAAMTLQSLKCYHAPTYKL